MKKHTCKLNIGTELSSGLKINKSVLIPADACIHDVDKDKEVIGKLTFGTKVIRDKDKFKG